MLSGLHFAITGGNVTKDTFQRIRKSKFKQNTKHKGMSNVKNKIYSMVCLKKVQTEYMSWQVRSGCIFYLVSYFGFCNDGRYLYTVHLDCADDVLNAPVRVLGGPHLLAISLLSRSS
jgi:hypothetical protein